MSKTLFAGAFLLLIVVVLVTCSSIEREVKYDEPPQPQHHHNKNKHFNNNNNNNKKKYEKANNKYGFKNKHTEFFDDNFNPKPNAIKNQLFKDHPSEHDKMMKNLNDNNINGTKITPIGIAVTFAPSFFQNMFNVIIMPQVRQVVDNIRIPNVQFGLPGPGGQGQVTGVDIADFNINIATLQPVYPSQFNWALSNIDLQVSATWSVKWVLKLCPCFGGCCFHITLFHCSGPVSVTASNLGLSGSMAFTYDAATSTVQVESPSTVNWQNSPTVNIDGNCGWFFDTILRILKAFGLNVWGDIQKAVNNAIQKAFKGGILGGAINGFLDKTLNAALDGIHICNYKFYEGESFMSIFTHETSDPSSPCLDSILPPTWLATAPKHDITLLARINFFPTFLPPMHWTMLCLDLPQKWFALPGGLSNMMRIDDVRACLGLDSNAGVYIVGEVDVSFFVGSESQLKHMALPYIKEANRQIAMSHAQEEVLLQLEVNKITEEMKKEGKDQMSCPFEGGIQHLVGTQQSAPWFACANIPLLEKILSWLPTFLVAFFIGCYIYIKKTSTSNLKSVETF